MLILTEDVVITCRHVTGIVIRNTSQDFVTIAGRRVLIDPDPENRPIIGCPNIGIGIKPCLKTLSVKTGYSDFITIGGRRVCLKAVTGLTDGTPPGIVMYDVRAAGQDFVSGAE